MACETATPWQAFDSTDGKGVWWWNEDDEDWFLESEPGDWMQFTDPNSGQPHWCHPDGRSFCSSLEKDDEHPAAIGPAYVLYVGTFPETVFMPTATVISSLEPTWRNFSFLDSVDEKNLVVNAAGFDAIQAHASAPEH